MVPSPHLFNNIQHKLFSVVGASSNVHSNSLTPLEKSLAARRTPMPQLADPVPEWGWSGMPKLSREGDFRLLTLNLSQCEFSKNVCNTYTQLLKYIGGGFIWKPSQKIFCNIRSKTIRPQWLLSVMQGNIMISREEILWVRVIL